MNLRTTAQNVKRSFDKHQPLIEVGISRENLLHNLHAYQAQYPNVQFAPVLKSNAYGHGLTTIAQLLDKESIAFFMVDSFYEARALRHAGIRSRIAILGYVQPEEIATSTLKNVDYAIVDLEQLCEVSRIVKKPTRLHLKLDTGMHRHGIIPSDLENAIQLLHANENLKVVAACSHFADADNPDPTHSKGQLALWKDMVQKLVSEFPTIEYRHIAATKGAAWSEEADANVSRLGIGLYGFDTSPSGSAPLAPVMELRSVISSIREVPAGDFVGYNATYTAAKTIRVATVPAGYFEGVDRRLSNKGFMLVHGIACPIVGRVSMNMTSIDVTAVPDAIQGDSVVAISRTTSDSNSIENIVRAIKTPEYTETEYVVLTHVPQHLKRVVE